MTDLISIDLDGEIEIEYFGDASAIVEISGIGPAGPTGLKGDKGNQGDKGDKGDKGETGDITPELEDARDRAEAAATASEAYKNTASLAAASTTADRGAVQVMHDAVMDARDDAAASAVASEAAKTDTIAARNAAQTAEVNATAAALNAEDASDDAALSANSSSQSAAEAAQHLADMEDLMANTSPDEFVKKVNNGSDFADPAAVRANIGAQEALETVSQAEAQAGTSTTGRVWTAQRVAQAIDQRTGGSLAGKAPIESPTFTGAPAAPTPIAGDNSTKIATTAYVRGAIDALVDAAPGTLDTLNELAAALGDDPNFATTISNQLAGKSNTGHVHTIADVTNLQATLDAMNVKAGGSITGKLTLVASAAGFASLNIPAGAVPTAPNNDDIWNNGGNLYMRVNGSTRNFWHSGNLFALSQAQAEAGTDAGNFLWSPVRVAQAIAAKASPLGHTHVMANITDLAAALALLATKADPALTGTPTAPTATPGTSSTQIATTAFAAIAAANAAAGKADTNHTHPISAITNLQSTLDGKFSTSGGTLTGDITISKAAGTNRILYFATGGSNRWAFMAGSAAEAGSNAGSDFVISRYDDTGTYVDSPLSLVRSTGRAYFTKSVDVTGNITATGEVTGYSDERLKTDIETIESALDKVNAMRGVTFRMNGKKSVGVVAQEIVKVLPEVVLEGDDDEKMLSVAYGNMAGIFIEAIKELKAEIDSLKAEIKLLKGV